MNKKMSWLLLPTMVLPYCTIFALSAIFLAETVPAMRYIMEVVFRGNGFMPVVSLLAWWMIAIVFEIIFVIMGIRRKWDALYIAKCAMIVKLIQIPAYIILFVLGASLFLLLPVFSILFVALIIILDYVTLLMTGMLTALAAFLAFRQKEISFWRALCIVLLQLLFCVDIISTVIIFRSLKQKKNYMNFKTSLLCREVFYMDKIILLLK